jgi:hypothetical protein
MKRRPRIVYTDSQKALMWDRWQKGESMHILQGVILQGVRFLEKRLCGAIGSVSRSLTP